MMPRIITPTMEPIPTIMIGSMTLDMFFTLASTSFPYRVAVRSSAATIQPVCSPTFTAIAISGGKHSMRFP